MYGFEPTTAEAGGSEQRTDVGAEGVTNRDREQGRHEHDRDVQRGPQSTLETEGVVAILSSPLLVHVCVSLRSDAFPEILNSHALELKV